MITKHTYMYAVRVSSILLFVIEGVSAKPCYSVSDYLGEKKKCSRKGLNFGMRVSFHLRNIALKFFSLGCSSFSNNPQFSKRHLLEIYC